MKVVLSMLVTVVVVAVGVYIGVYTGLLPAGRLDGGRVEASISNSLRERLGTSVNVDCPSRLRKQKDWITDCNVRRLDTRTESGVRVTQDDHRGHFHWELLDPLVLIGEPDKVPAQEPQAMATTRELFVTRCAEAFGGGRSVCECAFEDIASSYDDGALRSFAARTADGTLPSDVYDSIESCGGTTD